ncbi:MAG: hypothetical protein KC635_00850, partial [Myxococcales bacterium]|nr:hypothetical protein [Myxococcales bacterium]
ATGCKHEAIAGCGQCETCEGVSSVTIKVTGGSSRDQNETIRVRKNGSSGDIIWSGKVSTGASFTVNVPAGTSSIALTVQGANHYNETLKGTYNTNCNLASGATTGNSYIQFKVTAVTQRTSGESCDDGDECTTDSCTSSGCTHTAIPGCGACQTCEGVSSVNIKVTGGTSRDQNETIRVRKNGSSGTVIWSGKVATGSSFSVSLPSGTTSIALTVQGANHYYETLKGTYATDCLLAEGATTGNSYIQFKVMGVTQNLSAGTSCDDGDDCTTDTCTTSGCMHTQIAGCGQCEVCSGVQTVKFKVTGASYRDQNETIRVRKNSTSGTVLWSGKVSTGGTFTVTVPSGTTSLKLTVQGNYHYYETLKASFAADCGLAYGDQDGNSYIQFQVRSVTQSTEWGACP